MTTVAISGLPVANIINATDIIPFVQPATAGTTKSITKTKLFDSPAIATPTITNPTVSTGTFTSPTLVTPAIGAATGTSLAVTGAVTSSGTAGVGYATGAGGAVTQTVGRTNPTPSINKPTGSITLFSAAGTTAYTSFTVNNNTVAATDAIILSQQSGTDRYELNVTKITAATSFEITFRTTGGTTTETPVFNFAVIKGVAA